MVAIAVLLVIPLHPVNTMMLKLPFLGCLVAAWAGLASLAWRSPRLRAGALALPLLAVTPFLLPGAEIDEAELRRDYVRRLHEFEGTSYHWGGESKRGIDCSGLPRRAFRDALLAYGFRHLNGRAFRGHLEQWWFDASAKALGEGYRRYTVPLEPSGTIREMCHDGLVVGDLAVTTSGVHILAYVGEGRWIQADPGVGAVVTLHGGEADNSWFDAPVTTHRWTLLAKR